MTINTDMIPWTPVAIFGFVGTVLLLYRLVCQKKDATIQLLNERIAGLKDKAEDAKGQASDVLVQQLGIRVNLFEEELRRLRQDYSATQEQLTAKETALIKLRAQLEAITFLSDHDALTGVYNRSRFMTSSDDLLNSEQVEGGKLVFFAFDIDAFKAINDVYGHSLGDLVLVEFAERLEKTLGGDALIARYGGDEFVSVLKDCDLQCAKNKLSELSQAIRRPFIVEGKEIHVNMSTGVSLFPLHGRTPTELLQRADEAMSQAKGQGRGRYVIFS